MVVPFSYARVNANLDPKDRASMLAVFVEQKTSGNAEIETPEQHAHYYGYHIATLKVSSICTEFEASSSLSAHILVFL